MTAARSQAKRDPWWVRRLQPLIVVLLLAFALAIAAIFVLDGRIATGRWLSSETRMLDDARSAEEYEDVVRRHAELGAPLRAPGDNYSIKPLRIQLFIDSLVLEPAYGGLLLLFMLALRRLARGPVERWDWALQFASLLLATGVMLDLAENGMVIRAAEDGLRGLLAQATVDDVHRATRLKWAFLGAAMLMVGRFARDRRLPATPRSLRLGAWAAIAVAPLAAIQAARLRSAPTIELVLLVALAIAFAAALVLIGRAVWQLSAAVAQARAPSP